MAYVVRKVDYYYALVRDEIGAGARILTQLDAARVDLLAFTGFPNGRRVQFDFIPKNVAAFVRAARRMGLRISPRKRTFLITGTDRRGTIADILTKLANGGVSVTAVDATVAGANRFGALLWVNPADYRRAARLLNAR